MYTSSKLARKAKESFYPEKIDNLNLELCLRNGLVIRGKNIYEAHKFVLHESYASKIKRLGLAPMH